MLLATRIVCEGYRIYLTVKLITTIEQNNGVNLFSIRFHFGPIMIYIASKLIMNDLFYFRHS